MTRKTFLVATHLFLFKGNEVLLYLRKWWSQDGKYNVIAWHLDGNEDPKDAIIREAKEEAGIILQKNHSTFQVFPILLLESEMKLFSSFFRAMNGRGR